MSHDIRNDIRNDSELRWQLRQLPREREPGRDLWPGIAAQLGPQGLTPASRVSRWRLPGLATAAVAVLAVGLFVAAYWERAPGAAAPSFADAINRQADAIVIEYQAALAQLGDVPLPEELRPALDQLDRSAARIRTALAADPEAVFLLGQLRRTYARRLALTQYAMS
ncbi:hypothetical protein [Rehaibacterium terrae]|jgi:hypothetical protein|uniref:Uncharacterized protein n=1 Tax=Rehaibacterium terrae TaxID=1341696 RepID=A0A7W7XZ42_9GAMM|nr:hypothetical protein [Rehaibacterium terrae]MBB5015098.1 hypothetical protein [Rehaibacterium terrae]